MQEEIKKERIDFDIEDRRRKFRVNDMHKAFMILKNKAMKAQKIEEGDK